MLRNLVAVYGLGTAWLWWLFGAPRGPVFAATGVVLLGVTIALVLIVRRRSIRLQSSFEGISPRLITHAGTGAGTSLVDQKYRPHEDNDFEAHVGGLG